MYSVRLGGSQFDGVAAIDVDSTGALVVVGQTTSPDFPLVNPLQVTVPPDSVLGAANAFITKLDAGGRILFSTGWGGRAEDVASAIAIDRNLDIVVAGTTSSSDFFTTANAFQRTFAAAPCSGSCGPQRDAFVVRLSGDGQTIRYSTLFGGTNDETLAALAIDQAGSPHIAGVTRSTDLPVRNPLQTACDSIYVGNGCSGFVTKLTPDGSALQYSTYFGSRSYYVGDLGRLINGMSIDSQGNLVVVGTTQGNDLPVWRAVQPVNGSGPLFKSTDDGLTWTPSSAGMAGSGVWSLNSAGRESVLYASPLGGDPFRSDDKGATWRGATD